MSQFQKKLSSGTGKSNEGEKQIPIAVVNVEESAEKKQQKKCILKWTKAVFAKKAAGLCSDFCAIDRNRNHEKTETFKEAQKLGKNRYNDIGCLDNNRVKLTAPWPHEYIHANYVGIPSNAKRFICTQAPLEKTCADFWHMCIQERVEHILMLCNFIENGWKMSYEYFPTEKKTVEFQEKGQKVTVRFESSSRLKWNKKTSAKIQHTVLVVSDSNGASIRVNHYHWLDWRVRGVAPVHSPIIELLAKIRPSKSPIVVHCSSGHSAAGCIIMIEYIMDQLSVGQEIEESITILKKMRESRFNLLQTAEQYVYVHDIVLRAFRDMDLLDADAVESHEGFIHSAQCSYMSVPHNEQK